MALMLLLALSTAGMVGCADGSGSGVVTPVPNPGTAPQVVINEVLFNPLGNDADGLEWIELYNAGDQSVSLNGMILTGENHGTLAQLPNVTLSPGSFYLTILGDPNMTLPDDLTVTVLGAPNRLANGRDSVALLAASGTVIDRIGWSDAMDDNRVTIPQHEGLFDGQSIGRNAAGTDTDRPEDWALRGGPDAFGTTPGGANALQLLSETTAIKLAQTWLNQAMVAKGYQVLDAWAAVQLTRDDAHGLTQRITHTFSVRDSAGTILEVEGPGSLDVSFTRSGSKGTWSADFNATLHTGDALLFEVNRTLVWNDFGNEVQFDYVRSETFQDNEVLNFHHKGRLRPSMDGSIEISGSITDPNSRQRNYVRREVLETDGVRTGTLELITTVAGASVNRRVAHYRREVMMSPVMELLGVFDTSHPLLSDFDSYDIYENGEHTWKLETPTNWSNINVEGRQGLRFKLVLKSMQGDARKQIELSATVRQVVEPGRVVFYIDMIGPNGKQLLWAIDPPGGTPPVSLDDMNEILKNEILKNGEHKGGMILPKGTPLPAPNWKAKLKEMGRKGGIVGLGAVLMWGLYKALDKAEEHAPWNDTTAPTGKYLKKWSTGKCSDGSEGGWEKHWFTIKDTDSDLKDTAVVRLQVFDCASLDYDETPAIFYTGEGSKTKKEGEAIVTITNKNPKPCTFVIMLTAYDIEGNKKQVQSGKLTIKPCPDETSDEGEEEEEEDKKVGWGGCDRECEQYAANCDANAGDCLALCADWEPANEDNDMALATANACHSSCGSDCFEQDGLCESASDCNEGEVCELGVTGGEFTCTTCIDGVCPEGSAGDVIFLETVQAFASAAECSAYLATLGDGLPKALSDKVNADILAAADQKCEVSHVLAPEVDPYYELSCGNPEGFGPGNMLVVVSFAYVDCL